MGVASPSPSLSLLVKSYGSYPSSPGFLRGSLTFFSLSPPAVPDLFLLPLSLASSLRFLGLIATYTVWSMEE